MTLRGRILRPEWPGDADFGICLTHDVDRVKKTAFHSLYYFLGERRWRHISTLFDKSGAYWNFEKIMELEKKYDVKSTFFFLSEQDLLKDRPILSLLKPREWVLYYSSYGVSEPAVAGIIKRLEGENWEVALHGSYESYLRKDMLEKEKHTLETALGKRVIGVRQHYMRLDIPRTWHIQNEIGFEYDSSYGCHRLVEASDEWMRPFRPLETSFMILPVTIMDGYLFATYPDLSLAWDRCRNILRLARRSHALVTVIWHSQRFNEEEFPGWPRIYEKLIIEGKRMRAWMGPAREVCELFRHARESL